MKRERTTARPSSKRPEDDEVKTGVFITIYVFLFKVKSSPGVSPFITSRRHSSEGQIEGEQ